MKQLVSCLLIFGIIFLVACNNETQTGTTEVDSVQNNMSVDTVEQAADTVLSGCYSLIRDRDTASLQLQVKGTQASGSLSYNLFEKDRNDGSFEGEIINGTLHGWYLFRSEGIMSVREISFRIQPGYLWPGNGEVRVSHDTTMFKNLSDLKYDSSRAFVKVKCEI